MCHMVFAGSDSCDVTVNDVSVDVKCEIKLSNHDKSQQFIIPSDVSRGS